MTMGFRVREIQIQIPPLLFSYVTLGKLFESYLQNGKKIPALQHCQNENETLDVNYRQSHCQHTGALNKPALLPTSHQETKSQQLCLQGNALEIRTGTVCVCAHEHKCVHVFFYSRAYYNLLILIQVVMTYIIFSFFPILLTYN